MTGAELKAHRYELRLSLNDAARLVYVKRRSWARWETQAQVPLWVPELLDFKMAEAAASAQLQPAAR